MTHHFGVYVFAALAAQPTRHGSPRKSFTHFVARALLPSLRLRALLNATSPDDVVLYAVLDAALDRVLFAPAVVLDLPAAVAAGAEASSSYAASLFSALDGIAANDLDDAGMTVLCDALPFVLTALGRAVCRSTSAPPPPPPSIAATTSTSIADEVGDTEEATHEAALHVAEALPKESSIPTDNRRSFLFDVLVRLAAVVGIETKSNRTEVVLQARSDNVGAVLAVASRLLEGAAFAPRPTLIFTTST